MRFQGNHVLFFPKSLSDQHDYQDDRTLRDPAGGTAIVAHWHGGISHRFSRLHFDWFVPAARHR